MTNYADLETAERLKEAGFPQGTEMALVDKNIDPVAAPTIGELHALVTDYDIEEYTQYNAFDTGYLYSYSEIIRSIPLLADCWIWKHGNKKENV